MDWGFVKLLDKAGNEYQVACFALCHHHCGNMFIELFPNAKWENLFIGTPFNTWESWNIS